jgi:hypothetical protein
LLILIDGRSVSIGREERKRVYYSLIHSSYRVINLIGIKDVLELDDIFHCYFTKSENKIQERGILFCGRMLFNNAKWQKSDRYNTD